MKFLILAPARIELEEAVNFYNSESPGLGFQFAADVQRAFKRIEEFPDAWHPLTKSTRRYRLKGFPYGIIYHRGEDALVILAIMHMHREPDSWLVRLKT